MMASYEPEVGEMWHGGKKVMSPDTPCKWTWREQEWNSTNHS